ncbi:class I SAM-dependent methyltransferase [Mangrovibrevibacter kandeliae]|uniref:class I SAM-dependent methyltransferase n=1 Tax=Mangrovibrevibacter kandeliae TaxID=2968473 RepID=UPI003899A021
MTRLPLDPERFVLANTAPLAPPHVPELRLHLADEAHELWLKTEAELGEIGLPPPFWAFAWAGGQALARYVLDHPETVCGRRVVDFASGSGLVAIAAARAGAAAVTAVDVDRFSGAAARLNAALNAVSIDVLVADLVGRTLDVEVLLAGDVFFDKAMAEAVAPWFTDLTQAGIEVLVGDPGRAYLPAEQMTCLAGYEVPVTRALEDAEVKRSRVWRWRG